MTPVFLATTAGLLLAAPSISVRVLRRSRNLDGLLRPIVEAYGLEFIDSRPPPWFRTGPFPVFAGKIGNRHTEVLGIRGEYWSYRIVRVRRAGKDSVTWVRLYFERYRFEKADWCPTLPP